MSDDLTGENILDELDRERETAFIATVEFDADLTADDVNRIGDALEAAGYDTRMKANNSGYLVMRQRETDE